jgi:hypothetical protein
VLGIYTSPQVTVSQTEHLRAPGTLIWQYVSEESNFSKWINQFPISNCKGDSGKVIICYRDSSFSKRVCSVQIEEDKRIVQLILDESYNNPGIKDYVLKINLKSLRDGTTEINCKVQYRLNSLAARVANKLYFEGNQKNLLVKNMDYLHTYFEKV